MRAAADLIDVVHHELHCKLALDKAQIVTSSNAVYVELKAALGKYAGPAQARSGAKNLGIDFFGGAVRRSLASRLSQRARFDKLKGRNRKLLVLKRQGTNMRRL